MSAERPSGAIGPGDVAPSIDYGLGEGTGAVEYAYSQSGDRTDAGPDYSGYSHAYERGTAGGPGTELTGWHRNAAVLIGLGAFAAVTIGFIIYGLVVLLYGSHGGVPADTTSLPSSAHSPAPTSSPISTPISTTTVAAPPLTTPATNTVPTTAAPAPGTTTLSSTESPIGAATTSATTGPSSTPVGPPPPQGPVVLVPPQPRLGP